MHTSHFNDATVRPKESLKMRNTTSCKRGKKMWKSLYALSLHSLRIRSKFPFRGWSDARRFLYTVVDWMQAKGSLMANALVSPTQQNNEGTERVYCISV